MWSLLKKLWSSITITSERSKNLAVFVSITPHQSRTTTRGAFSYTIYIFLRQKTNCEQFSTGVGRS